MKNYNIYFRLLHLKALFPSPLERGLGGEIAKKVHNSLK
jgi:hypothetical protein